jgi:hypothetical protein
MPISEELSVEYNESWTVLSLWPVATYRSHGCFRLAYISIAAEFMGACHTRRKSQIRYFAELIRARPIEGEFGARVQSWVASLLKFHYDSKMQKRSKALWTHHMLRYE